MSATKFFRGSQPKFLGQTSAKLKDRLGAIELPERFKGTIVEKWAGYWKNLLRDYKDVIVDSGRKIKNNPVRSSIFGTIIGTTYLTGKYNPDLELFNEKLRTYNNEMILIHESCHNKSASNYLTYIEKCINEGVIRRMSIGIASIMWVDDYSESLAIFKAVCPHLQPQYSTFHKRIIDIGFWNKWWKLDKIMVDFDVAED